MIALTLVLVYTGVSVSGVKPRAAGGSTEMINRPKITFPGNDTVPDNMALTDPAIGITVNGAPYNKTSGPYNDAKIITDADQIGANTTGFDKRIPTGSLATTVSGEWYVGGFGTSSQKYDLAHNDFEISYIVYRGYWGKGDYGTTFTFHNDPNYVPGKYNGQGSLGIYGFAENPTEYHTLQNAIAAELDIRDQNSNLYGGYAALDPRKEGMENDTNTGSHIAITKPTQAVKATSSNTGNAYISIFDDEYLAHRVWEGGWGAPKTWTVDKHSLMNVKWTLTNPGDTDSLEDNIYTMKVTYTHATDENGQSNVICSTGPYKGHPLKLQVSKTFTYQEMIDNFGGNEVYIGFSGSIDKRGASAFYLPNKILYNVKHLYYNEYEGIPVADAVKVPALPDPEPYKGEKYYAAYGSVDLYSKIKNFDDYVFVSAHNQTTNLPVDNVNLTQVTHNNNDEMYHMYYTKKVVAEPGAQEPKSGYRRIVFDPTADGKIGDGALGSVKTFDAREEITWQDAWSKMSPAVPAPTYKDGSKVFAGWTPVFPSAETKIGSVQPGTNPIRYVASYKEAVIEDPNTPTPPEGYKRIIFDPTANGRIKDGSLGVEKTFDVLSSDNLTWNSVWELIKDKTKANYKDNDKIFDKWNPALPGGDVKTSSLANSTTFVASYKLNPEIPVGIRLEENGVQILLFAAASAGIISFVAYKRKSQGILN